MLKAESNIRNGLISKIHIAKKQLAMDDDAYQAMLQRVAGKTSCKDMNTPQLEKVVKEFNRLGFVKPPVKRVGVRKLADSITASKIRALWLSLYHIGEVRDPSEDALTSYTKRVTGISALQWITPAQSDRVIKALRGWLERVGYVTPTAGDINDLRLVRKGVVAKDSEEPTDYTGMAAKAALIRMQLTKLKLKDADFLQLINDRGFGQYNSINLIAAQTYDAVIELLGKEVRSVIKR